ncbi:MAG: DinB family protein [Gemmatimonadetes bacterium]|nr:DinB family protein [Gemmatimonadota bacterium]
MRAWRTNDRVTRYLVANLPAAIWGTPLPDESRRTVRQLAVHLHNARCSWLRVLAAPHGIAVPARVNFRTVTRAQLVAALKRSGASMEALLAFGVASGGTVPATRAYTWRNLPLDVPHVLAYFVAHEAHHRGQLVMVARQAGHRMPRAVVGDLWQWTRLARQEPTARR